MSIRLTRRQVIKGLAVAGVALLLPGCSKSPHNLTFNDSDGFYRDFDDALKKNLSVTVSFDGKNKIGKNSRMLDRLRSATNHDEVWKAIHKLDTEEGRKALALAFTPELLAHESTTISDSSRIKAETGEVIDPGTIILVVAIVLILTAGATTAIGCTAHVKAQTSPPGFELDFRPAKAN